MNNRLMRILVFFDLPVKTKAERSAAAKFRNFLLMDGYHMVQLSVYVRICCGMDSVAAHKRRLATAQRGLFGCWLLQRNNTVESRFYWGSERNMRSRSKWSS